MVIPEVSAPESAGTVTAGENPPAYSPDLPVRKLANSFTPLPDLPCPRRASRSRAHHPATAAAVRVWA
jgi:hypothetical protein